MANLSKMIFAMPALYTLSACDQLAENQLNNIKAQVAQDAVRQYEIAKKGGSAMDQCVQAGLVAAAYLQAQDESNYTIWKGMEKLDCARAGI